MIDSGDIKSQKVQLRADHRLGSFFAGLQDVFGTSFLQYLVLTYFGLKGVALALAQSAMLPYFQAMGVSGNTYQLASVVSTIPWSMKGFVGVLSDVLPIGRFHKRGYLLLSGLIGLIGFVLLVAVKPNMLDSSDVWWVASLFCAANTMFATFDLLCEGKYSELMREEHAGSEILTFVWTAVSLGGLFAAVFVGFTVDMDGTRPMLFACVPIALVAIWRTLAGDLPEKPARSWMSLRLKVRSAPGLFVCAGAMAAGSLAIAICTAVMGRQARDIMVLVVSIGLVGITFQVLPRTLARCNLYMFIISVLYLDLSGPLAYYYTGGVGCIVDAPHFSYGYFISVSNIVGSIFAVLGASLFQYMQHWTFISAFGFTICLQVVAAVFDLLIISRLNIRFGISDPIMYLFGDAACQSIAAQMQMMPLAMLTSRLCPRGAEATVFAILAGFQNFGNAVSSILGVQLAEAFGVEASKDGPCDFANLSLLVVVSHCLLPLLGLPFTWFLVPRVRVDDDRSFQEASPPPSFSSPGPSPPASPCESPLHSPAGSQGSLPTYPLPEEDEMPDGRMRGDSSDSYHLMQDGIGVLMSRQVSLAGEVLANHTDGVA